jgi:uncharacterized circularly permuted ATP-grasp superfamily protein
MLENREILKRTFELFKKLVKPVYNYTHFKRYIRIPYRSWKAYYCINPRYLIQLILRAFLFSTTNGAELVEGKDLIEEWLQPFNGRRAGVIYRRRVDDDFIDPLVFNKHSLLGTPII